MRKIFVLIISVFVSITIHAKTVYLNELNLSNVLQDWGYASANTNIFGMPLSVAGKSYKNGVGTHSISRFLINLDGKAKTFSGAVGADDYNDFQTKMEFKIIADQKEIWTSGIMTKGMEAKPFNVNLKGVKKILLLVTEGGDGIMYDHADWLDAKFETSGSIESEPARGKTIAKEKYILTPSVSPLPQIHSPLRYGVGVNRPFLYTIAASGEKPLRYSAYNLPKGLELDAQTGQITGKIAEKGTYHMVIRVENSKGGDWKKINIEVGSKINLTPPMGWNSWNSWALNVDEAKVKDAADLMSAKLKDYGWSYVCIDDGWEAEKRTASGELLSNSKFPDMEGLGKYIHSKGLKFGIYSSPGPMTCGEFLGSYQHEQQDANTWDRWGVDLLKHDYCYYNQIAPNPTEEDIKKPYFVMREALDNIGRDISYCGGYGAPNVWIWGEEAGGNYWRTTRDITDEWNVVTAIGCFQDVCASATKPGSYNDPDMLVLGKVGLAWRSEVKDTELTPDEQYSHMSLWSLLSAPLFIGCDMSDMDDFTLSLLTNGEVLAINQDPDAAPAKKTLTKDGQIWYKPLHDGSIAVGLFFVDPYEIHWDKSKVTELQMNDHDMEIDFAQLGLVGSFKIRDLWRQQDLGVFETKFEAKVPYHGVKLIRLIPN